MVQSFLIQRNMTMGAILEFQPESTFADLSDMNPTEPKRKYKTKRHQDNPFLAICEDPTNAVFWVPAQFHPEVAPNEFDAWIKKRTSALSTNEKHATRRKSILALHSYTSEQLTNECKMPPISESPTKDHGKAELPIPAVPLSPLIRRHTYNNESKRKDLLIKKEKGELVVLPKADAGLKRSARARPRKDLSNRPDRRCQARTEPKPSSTVPLNSVVSPQKTTSKPVVEESNDKDLLDEINSLLSTKIVIKDKGKHLPQSDVYPTDVSKRFTKTLTQLDSQDRRVSIMTSMKQKINGAAPDLFDYFDAPVQEVVAPTAPSQESSFDSTSSENTTSSSSHSPSETFELSLLPSPTPNLDSPNSYPNSSASSQLTLIADEPAIDSSASSQLSVSEATSRKSSDSNGASSLKSTVPPKGSPTRNAKKPFSWFWNSESLSDKKVEAQRMTYNERPKLFSPKTAPPKRIPNCSKIPFEMDLSSSPIKPKAKAKQKPKSKISSFFLGKNKTKHMEDNPKKELELQRPSLSHFPDCDPYDLPPHVEQQLYRLSHQKLAVIKRPIAQQVLISNLMLAYLRAVNPSFRSQQACVKPKGPVPRPRSPHLISKERYKNSRRLPISSSSEDEISSSDSSSDDDSPGSFGFHDSPRLTLA
ncbi:hypothetical protein L0F63_005889 [Massospora cicadina]|nr:hypothetical protein L0F63_005889 [Massospora cicadina]